MRKTAAVTICSTNYMAKALVLFGSYINHHPDHDFYIVIVDRKNEDFNLDRQELTIVWVEDLQIPDILQYAFAFDVIEFNTNVKPTVLSRLLVDYENVVYLDPDIKVYAPFDPVFEALTEASIVVTPHSNMPVLDGCKPGDLELLRMGVFNLGFVAVSQCQEAFDFLNWWSARCLEYGFYEPQLGLAVDQKWVNLAPCYFQNLRILHDVGLNVAFWNLHERKISSQDGKYVINENILLRFIHFSSFDASSYNVIAHKQTRFAPGSRPDFEELAKDYAAELIKESSDVFSSAKYSFDYFEDGTYITPALRRFYATLRDTDFVDVANPFEADGQVNKFAVKNKLVVKGNIQASRPSFRDLDRYQLPIKIFTILLKLSLRLLGPVRYFSLMAYLAHISSLRNQAGMFRSENNDTNK